MFETSLEAALNEKTDIFLDLEDLRLVLEDEYRVPAHLLTSYETLVVEYNKAKELYLSELDRPRKKSFIKKTVQSLKKVASTEAFLFANFTCVIMTTSERNSYDYCYRKDHHRIASSQV